MPRKIHVIVNPAAGQATPVLHTMNTVFNEAGVEWNMSITKEIGDGRRLAQEAVDAGVDVVAAYGGDGTVADVAGGLVDSDVPLAILPGGTANVLSDELLIPQNLGAACELAVGAGTVRPLDIGRVDDTTFLLRLGIGFEAAMVEGADRALKERLGSLAYGLAALQALREPTVANYQITLDGKEVECEGLTCVIANSGNLGAPGLRFAENISVSDGLLDVIVIRRADVGALLSVIASVAGFDEIDSPEDSALPENEKPLQHWQARDITVVSDPAQTVQADGELMHSTPVSASVSPQAVKVIVPVTPRQEQ